MNIQICLLFVNVWGMWGSEKDIQNVLAEWVWKKEIDLNWKKEIWRWGKEWNKEPKLGVRERKKKVFGSKLLFHFQPTSDWEVQISPWKWGDKINSLASSPSCQENILGVHNRNKHFWNDCLVRIFQIRPFMASLFLSFQYSFLIQ